MLITNDKYLIVNNILNNLNRQLTNQPKRVINKIQGRKRNHILLLVDINSHHLLPPSSFLFPTLFVSPPRRKTQSVSPIELQRIFISSSPPSHHHPTDESQSLWLHFPGTIIIIIHNKSII